MTSNGDAEAPSETTRLLPREATPSTTATLTSLRASRRPAISPAVRHAQTHGVDSFGETFDDLLGTATEAEKTGFGLVVLLQMYIHTARSKAREHDLWEDWTKEKDREADRKDLEQRISAAWSSFIAKARAAGELESCLWTPFPLESGKAPVVRVVDMLQDPNAPPALLNHDLITRSLAHTWKSGFIIHPADSTAGSFRRALMGATTPRILHALDLIIQLLYLGLLAHYLLYPPSRPIITLDSSGVDVRGILLMIYAMSNVLGVFNYFLPCVLVALAFLSTLPASPFPGDASYSALSAGFLLHIILLHLPRAPNLSLLAPKLILPLSTLFFHEFSLTVYPAMLFFSPALLVGLYLLSLSLVEDSPVIPPRPGPSSSRVYVLAAPMEVREALLALLVTLLVLMVFSVCLLVLFNAAMHTSSKELPSKWDRYSPSTGNRARRAFLAAIVRYTSPYYFPPPFNVPPLVFIYFPVGFLRLYGAAGRRFTRLVEGIFWWSTVGICSLIVAGLSSSFYLIPFIVRRIK